MARRRKGEEQRFVMISVVAERFGIHPQTLRLYEREGLITPVRSAGNTRLYDEKAIRRLEMILTLTRELELDHLLDFVRQEHSDRRAGVERQHALVKIERGALVKR